jgi:hypothetical protein
MQSAVENTPSILKLREHVIHIHVPSMIESMEARSTKRALGTP